MTNLYVTNTDPREAPKDLDDNRLITAALETAQILVTALYRRGLWGALMYRPLFNHNHECVKWAAASRNNFRWTYHYGMAVCDEYSYRFDNDNSNRIMMAICWDAFKSREVVFPLTELTEFPNTTPYKTELDVEVAYRRYMNEDKWTLSAPRWTRRQPPSWKKDSDPRRGYPVGLFA